MNCALSKRFIALLLAMVMVLGMTPMTVLAADGSNDPASGFNSEPTDPSDPSEDPSDPSEDPSEPSEDPSEPSEDPSEPSEDPSEPSEDPSEPSEDPSEPVALIDEEEDAYGDGYYKVISEKSWTLAPGIKETELVLNNDAGSHRQVSHIVEVDVDNSYTKVMPSYKGMKEGLDSKNYGVQIMSQQAAYAEKNGYGNVVAAMNLSLSWYNTGKYLLPENAHLIGEPLAYVIMDGSYYENSEGKTSGSQTCVVINYDEKDGVARPDDIPKTEIRATSSAITGWEEQVIPANFGFLVKDGVNQYKQDHVSDPASRSFVGIKADGDIVMVMNDGRQSPYSAGFNSYEMAELMIELGCVQAVNGDGGGSSTFLSQRPGEELKINCSPSDGAERPTTHGILVISTAPADGQFARATISSEDEYYTPGSTVSFTALGTDLVGTETEIPADVTWQLKDAAMGTIENGVFISNGITGTVTAQMVYNGEVVGEDTVQIVIPTSLVFGQAQITVPYGKEISLKPVATVNDGRNEVVLKDSDITFTFTNDTLGTLNGFLFTAVSEAPENINSTVTAKLNHGSGLTATANMSLGKGSEVLFAFESEGELEAWNTGDVNGNDIGFAREMSIGTRADGQVHDGEGAMRLYMNPAGAPGISNGGYGQMDLYLDDPIIVENAKSLGFWAYIPDEYEHCWIRVLYWYDPDGDGKFDKKNTITVINQPEVYNTWDESGWKYFSVDISAYDKVMIAGVSGADKIAYNASKNDANNFRFIEFMFPHTSTNDLWKTYGTINGPQTVYIDNITVDYSDAVEDREAPKFKSVTTSANDTTIELKKYETVTLSSNVLSIQTAVAEDTAKTNATGLNGASAKAYVDGVEVGATYSNGRINMAEVAVADGVHRVKFEIADNAGNKSVVVRLVEVKSGVDASTVQLIPKDAALDSLYGGSLYWMDLKATDIETIQSVSMRVDLNALNHWELAHTEYAPGFTGTYSIDAENNAANITITRTGTNSQSGEAVIASLPIRVVSFDDIAVDGYDAKSFWNDYGFWPYDLKVDVDMGKISYVSGSGSNVCGLFSNEEFSVATELYTAFNNAAFKIERGTAHVHTAQDMDSLEATCTTAGFAGRTFCDVCDSIVSWGTDVAAKGHNVNKNIDGIQICSDCGKTFGYAGGEMLTGWHEIDGKTCYFAADGAAANGDATIDGVDYKFEEFALTAPALVHDGTAYTGYWAGKQMEAGWHTLNGKQYYINGIYVATGVTKIAINTNVGAKWHIFNENGVFLEDHTGLYVQGEDTYYAVDGICTYAGLVEEDGYFYYINSSLKAVKNTKYYFSRVNGLWPEGVYYGTFDEAGRITNPYVDPDTPVDPSEPSNPSEPTEPAPVKQGVVKDEDGKIRYYVDGVATYAGLVEQDGYYYYINSTLTAVTNTQYYFSKVNGLWPEGIYYGTFDTEGRITNPYVAAPEEPSEPTPSEPTPSEPTPSEPTPVKQGVVKDEDGKIRYYVDGVATYAGLVEQDGYYYYINSTLTAVTNTKYYFSKVNGLWPEGIYYGTFDAEGRITNPYVAPEAPEVPSEPSEEPSEPTPVKQGIVKDEDGKIRYYVDGEATYAGLVYQDGYYYYINSTKTAVTNTQYYFSKVNGLLEAGTYYGTFDAEGHMEMPPLKC